MGVFYDVAFDRVLAPPATMTGNGILAGVCTPGTKPNGTTTDTRKASVSINAT